MRQRKEILFLLLLLLFLSTPGYAEDIKNYGDCDVCPGTIHYGAEETKRILGREGLKIVSNLKRARTIKIDLDGFMRNGSEYNSDKGYEIIIQGDPIVIYIRAMNDQSYLQVVTDFSNTLQSSSMYNWNPEIYLQSSQAEEINLNDSLSLAWKKIKKSTIYQWVNPEDKETEWNVLLKNKLLQALKLMAE